MFFKDPKFSECKRNKEKSYISTVDRLSIENEAHKIFAFQRDKSLAFATEEIEKAYIDILLGQRSFADGPAKGPYSGNQIQRMRGKCTFKPDEYRAAKSSYSFQLFNLCQRINYIRLIQDGKSIPLNNVERQIVYDLAHEKPDLDYYTIRKYLKLSENICFSGIRYDNGKLKEIEKKRKN